MLIPKDRLRLNKRCTVAFSEWSALLRSEPDVRRVFVGVSGYEARSRYWFQALIDADNCVANESNQVLICGIREHCDVLSRPENDSFYKGNNLDVFICGGDEPAAFHERFNNVIKECISCCGPTPCEIHVDFSSMPRSWYCEVPFILDATLRENDHGYLWYTPGLYPTSAYPTVGVNDFRVFSGKASLAPAFRTHLMGLGFDKIRSQAIWSVIDPENLIAFYADPASCDEYIERVRADNEDVLRSAQHVLRLPLTDVAFCTNRLIATVREFRRLGDVILVPDGPKPLVLAASLTPSLVGVPGIVCFHVARKMTASIDPVDVFPNGDPVALRFEG